MRRGVWLLVFGVFAAALGAASAYAAGNTTTTTTTSTTSTTTTGTTTTTPPPPTYAPLGASYLSKGCVGAGSAAIAVPGRRVLMLGTPAGSRGPSAYPTKAPIVRFLSSTAFGSGCTTARVGLTSVALFGDAVTASSVTATHGRGGVSGFAINGSPVALSAGRTVRVGGWGEVAAGKTVGRITAPLVLRLLAAHGGLPAGTTIAVAFGAAPLAVHKSKPKHHHSSGSTQHRRSKRSGSSRPVGHARKHHKPKVNQPLTAVPGLGFRPSHYVFPIDGGAAYIDTYGASRNDVYDGWHHGDDLFAPLGTPVLAVATGTLSLVGWNELGGWRVWLTDKMGNSFYYAHLAGYARWILTHPHVRAGQVIGFLGRTGDAFTTAPHLHFEIHPHQPAFVALGYDGAVDPTTYLHKWKIEHVPAAEIPRPARLKAPVGAPRQEAAVVWHQLLVARHLLGLKTPKAKQHSKSTSKSVPHRSYVRPLHLAAAGAMPLPIAQVRPTAAQVSASENNMPLLVGGPLGGLLAVSAAAGAFAFRRRRRTPELPAADASS